MTASMTSLCMGFVIAEVIPCEIAIDRNAPLTPSRLGSPKLILDAPQVVLHFSSR